MTRERPIAFNPDTAANAAMQVFWAPGDRQASTRDILDAMAISRSSLHQTFGNKERLFIEALQRYREASLERLERRLAAARLSCSTRPQTLDDAFAGHAWQG